MILSFTSALRGEEHPTIALWLFDEPVGLYPSCVLNDAGPNDYPMVIGFGGQIVPGKFGNALEPLERPKPPIPEGEAHFGLKRLPPSPGRKVSPLSWHNADFCALMTSGENHLRKEVGFPQVTRTQLNLGEFDWTVEFWYKPTRRTGDDGVVFEIGQGPRGENDRVTRLLLHADLRSFELQNFPSGTRVGLPSDEKSLQPGGNSWHHIAFVYAAREKALRHFVDGKLQVEVTGIRIASLEPGEEDYMTVGRDGLWKRPLPGAIDELRFSAAALYRKDFRPPESFSPFYNGTIRPLTLKKGPPLLFPDGKPAKIPVPLGGRKYLFIDDAIVDSMANITFCVNPPRLAERVVDNIRGQFRKHLTVVEDDSGRIRIYNSVEDDYLQVLVSKDGIHFEAPDLGVEHKGHRNITIAGPVGGLGTPFIDPNGPPEERWKYFSDYHRRGIFLFVSPDGFRWKRYVPYVLPFRSGTQSCVFYDDQQQLYLGYHRSDVLDFPSHETCRVTAFTRASQPYPPWPFGPLSDGDVERLAKEYPMRDPQPWYLDNGPLTPGGFSFEYPHLFTPIDTLDPSDTDIYITKAIKYPWAPDVYLAFPIVYFHYEVIEPPARLLLMDPRRERGSGPLETQLAVSRDGLHWKRYPRPAYVGIGRHEGRDLHTAYLAQGMVRRGEEIWQYYYGETQYHSSWVDRRAEQAVYRVVQRLDGFVSADAPYDREGIIITVPFVFEGNRLVLNIDTEAAGYAQVGFLDENGKPIAGFSVDDCVYINGDFIATEVEWIKGMEGYTRSRPTNQMEAVQFFQSVRTSADVSPLAGKVVRLMFRLRGAKLYAMQFVTK
jgi:hypothetical protein